MSLVGSPNVEEMEAGGSGGTKHVHEDHGNKFEADIGPAGESMTDFDNKLEHRGRTNTTKHK